MQDTTHFVDLGRLKMSNRRQCSGDQIVQSWTGNALVCHESWQERSFSAVAMVGCGPRRGVDAGPDDDGKAQGASEEEDPR